VRPIALTFSPDNARHPRYPVDVPQPKRKQRHDGVFHRHYSSPIPQSPVFGIPQPMNAALATPSLWLRHGGTIVASVLGTSLLLPKVWRSPSPMADIILCSIGLTSIVLLKLWVVSYAARHKLTPAPTRWEQLGCILFHLCIVATIVAMHLQTGDG